MIANYTHAVRYLLGIISLCASVTVYCAQTVLGKLGQATSQISIYPSPSSRKAYYTLRPYEYIIVKKLKDPRWLQVVMQNHKLGYVAADKIAQLPYDVILDQTKPPERSHDKNKTMSQARIALAGYSLKYIGTPYKFGGNDIQQGIDCSGFVKKLYGEIGIHLPRTAAEQAFVGKPILRLEHLQAGDRLYFWEHRRSKIGHAGLYLGNGYFVHSSASRKGVATDSLAHPKWRKTLVAARR